MNAYNHKWQINENIWGLVGDRKPIIKDDWFIYKSKCNKKIYKIKSCFVACLVSLNRFYIKKCKANQLILVDNL